MSGLVCEGVSMAYATRSILSGVDLTVEPGTVTAILGASGSGKTTLLRIVTGLLSPGSGTVSIGGNTVFRRGELDVPPERRAIGYVAQDGALFPHLTVGENITFGLPRSERKTTARTAEVLELVGLDVNYAQRPPHQLSGGEQRRVSLARALAPRPKLILLDEPFSGLDASLRAETRQAVLTALSDEEATAVLVTHDQAEALSMGSQVGVLRDGRLVQTGPPRDVYDAPADLDTARFVGEAIVVDGNLAGPSVECVFGTLAVAGHVSQATSRVGNGAARVGAVKVMVRPEQLRLTEPPVGGEGGSGVGGGASNRYAVPATVTGSTFYGPVTSVLLVLDDAHGTRAVAATQVRSVPSAGTSVGVEVVGPVMVYAVEVV